MAQQSLDNAFDLNLTLLHFMQLIERFFYGETKSCYYFGAKAVLLLLQTPIIVSLQVQHSPDDQAQSEVRFYVKMHSD